MATKTKATTRASWLPAAARVLWWALVLVFLAIYAADIAALIADPQSAFEILVAHEAEPAAIAAALGDLGWSQPTFLILYLLPEIIATAAFVTVGLLIGQRRSGDWFTWFISLWMIVFGVTSTSTFAISGLESAFVLLYNLPILFSYVGIVTFLFAFPDGKFIPPWTRILAVAWSLFILSTLVVEWFEWDSSLSAMVIVPLLIAVLYSYVYRYRNVFAPAQKEQTKWLVAAIVANIVLVALAGVLADMALAAADSTDAVTYILLGNTAEFTGNLLLVAAVGISILRYRLWDIDVIVNRALIYGPLSLILAGVFAASVVIFNQSTRQLFGAEDANTSAVISALIVATVFTPMRSRIEGWINRRLYADQTNLARELVEISDPRFALSASALTKLVAERIPAVMNSEAGAVYLPAGARAFKQAAASGRKLASSFSVDAKARGELAAGKVTNAGPGQLLVPLYVPRLRSKELMGVLALGLRKNGRATPQMRSMRWQSWAAK